MRPKMQKSQLVSDLFEENLAYAESAATVLETAFQNEAVDCAKLNVEKET